MLKALVLSPTPTWPLNYGNRKRVYSICKRLQANGFSIHFVHYASEVDWRESIPDAAADQMAQQWHRVDHVFPSVPLHPDPEGDVHHIDEWWDPALENHLQGLFSRAEYDLVWVNYTWLSKGLDLGSGQTFKVLDTHDKFSGRDKLLSGNNITPEFFYTSESEELMALNRADLAIAIKSEEEAAFREMGYEGSLATILHVDAQVDSDRPTDKSGFVTFGFIGANNNINLENITRFLQAAEGVFQRTLPPLKFKIAGSICDALTSTHISAEARPFVDLVGPLEEAEEFYDAVDVAVVPMEFSSGLKIKVGEAFSHGKALIAHQHAMEGYTPHHEYHECTSMASIAESMVRVAHESEELGTLERASRDAFAHHDNQIEQVVARITKFVRDRVDVILVSKPHCKRKQLPYSLVCEAWADWWGWRHIIKKVVMGRPVNGVTEKGLHYCDDRQLADLRAVYPNARAIFLTQDEPGKWDSAKDWWVGGADAQRFPLLGHKSPAAVQAELVSDAPLGCLVIGEFPGNPLHDNTGAFLFEKNEYVHHLTGDSFDEILTSWKSFLEINLSYPRIVVVLKQSAEITLAERVVLDLCGSLAIRSFYLDAGISSKEVRLCRNGHQRATDWYQETFYNNWEHLEGRLRTDQGVHQSQLSSL